MMANLHFLIINGLFQPLSLMTSTLSPSRYWEALRRISLSCVPLSIWHSRLYCLSAKAVSHVYGLCLSAPQHKNAVAANL